MPLGACPGCGKQVPDSVAACPDCGCPIATLPIAAPAAAASPVATSPTSDLPASKNRVVAVDLKGWGCKNPVWRKDGTGPDLGEKRERAMVDHIVAALAEHSAQGWRSTHDVSYLALLREGRLHWEVHHSVLGLTSHRLDFTSADIELTRP